MRQANIPPCCCMGSITPIPPRWVVVSTYNATGELADLNDGVICTYFQTSEVGGVCLFRCIQTTPFRSVYYRRRRVASAAPERTAFLAKTVSTGTVSAIKTETIPESDGCLGDYFMLGFSTTGTLPTGTSWGDLLRVTCFRLLHDALLAFPDASQTCVPPL